MLINQATVHKRSHFHDAWNSHFMYVQQMKMLPCTLPAWNDCAERETLDFQQMRFPCKTLNVDFSPISSAMNHNVQGNMQMFNILGVCVFCVVSRYHFSNIDTSLRGRVLDYVHNPETLFCNGKKWSQNGWDKSKKRQKVVRVFLCVMKCCCSFAKR